MQKRHGPQGWEDFQEEMGLPRPEGRVDLGIRESSREQHERRPGGRNVIMGCREIIGRRVRLEHSLGSLELGGGDRNSASDSS